MPLSNQVQSLPFVQGVDTKSDPRLSAKPSRVEGMVIQGGTLVKRPGTQPLTATISTGGNQTVGEALFPFENELVRINGGTAYGLSSVIPEWVAKPGGGHYSKIEAVDEIQRNSRSQFECDQATANGITVYAWVELTGGTYQGLHIMVVDDTTGTVFFPPDDTRLANTSTARFPRCLVIGRNVVILWAEPAGGNLCSAYVDTTSPATTPVRVVVKNNMSTSSAPAQLFDAVTSVVAGVTKGFAIYFSSTNTKEAKLVAVNALGAAQPATATYSAIVGGNLYGMGLEADSNGVLYFFYCDDAGTPESHCKTIDNAGLGAIATFNTGGGQFWSVSTVESSAGNVTAVFFLSPASYTTATLHYIVANSGAVTTAITQIPCTYDMAPISRALLYDGAVVFAAVSLVRGALVPLAPALVQTAYLMDLSGNPIARMLPGLVGYTVTTTGPVLNLPGRLAATTSASDLATQVLIPTRGRLNYSSSTDAGPLDTTPLGISRVHLKVVSAATLPVNKIGLTTYIGGAVPRTYDGLKIVEAGIPLAPDYPTDGGAATGSLSAGVYSWKAVYSWVNGRGEIVRSAVSAPLTYTMSAGAGRKINVPTLPLSSRDVLLTSVIVELYRTEANGTLYYRDETLDLSNFNSLTGTQVQITSSQTDAALITGELLYTTGGVLDWLAPPAYSIAVNHKTRLVIAGLEDPYEWRCSTEVINGESVRFNEVLGGFVPRDTGAITGLASMDGNLIIFTSGNAAYLVQGDGPNNLGQNGWPAPQLITSVNNGLTDTASVISSADGIFFKTSRGFMMLGRGLQCEYIGADVEAFNGLQVRCATLRPEVEQVWFQCDDGDDLVGGLSPGGLYTHDGGVVLIYDWHYRQWDVLRGYGAVDACYYQGKYTRIQSNGVVLQEQPNTWVDTSNAHYSQTLETNWIKMSGVQGFQRLMRAELLGLFGSPCTLTWDAAYNYDPTYASADTTTTAIASQAVGTSVQLRRGLRIQKCEAVKFRFTITTASGSGQGMGLTDLSLEFGVKTGAFRLPASQSI